MVAKKAFQKRFTLGLEVEFFLINKGDGTVAHGADDIIKKTSEASREHAHTIKRESAKNLIEVASYPDVDGANAMSNLIEGLKLLLYTADQQGYAVLPLGTYPGRFTPSMRREAHYNILKKLHGDERFQISGLCAGCHCHYSLPWGVFDKKHLTLKNLSDSKNQDSLVNVYNFLIAADPVLTTFMQSSPFYQGRYIGKDARMVVYRGPEDLEAPKGLRTSFSRFSALPKYKHSGTDLISAIEDRYRDRMKAFADAGISDKDRPEYRSMLSTNWTPVKVNPHGTLEQRGMDMNHLPLVFSVSVLVWRMLHYIQDEFYKVLPHDSAKKEPFRIQNKVIYIAPDTHVKNRLQALSAYEGLENDEMYTYCKRLVSLVKALDGRKVEWLLRPLETMLDGRKTTSDNIIAQARELGHKDLKKTLPAGIASEIAKTHSKRVFEDIVLMQKMIEANTRLL